MNRERDRGPARIPEHPQCAICTIALSEPFGWCSNCSAAYCFACGRNHFCMESCLTSGCLAGFCVRVVNKGVLAATWGLPESD
jgi:hypothetical protein